MGNPKGETFELIIKDGEGRLWEVRTDASRDVVFYAIKFLREVNDVRMAGLVALLQGRDYIIEANLRRLPIVDFEM